MCLNGTVSASQPASAIIPFGTTASTRPAAPSQGYESAVFTTAGVYSAAAGTATSSAVFAVRWTGRNASTNAVFADVTLVLAPPSLVLLHYHTLPPLAPAVSPPWPSSASVQLTPATVLGAGLFAPEGLSTSSFASTSPSATAQGYASAMRDAAAADYPKAPAGRLTPVPRSVLTTAGALLVFCGAGSRHCAAPTNVTAAVAPPAATTAVTAVGAVAVTMSGDASCFPSASAPSGTSVLSRLAATFPTLSTAIPAAGGAGLVSLRPALRCLFSSPDGGGGASLVSSPASYNTTLGVFACQLPLGLPLGAGTNLSLLVSADAPEAPAASPLRGSPLANVTLFTATSTSSSSQGTDASVTAGSAAARFASSLADSFAALTILPAGGDATSAVSLCCACAKARWTANSLAGIADPAASATASDLCVTDCAGVRHGTAQRDACGVCAGGTTGLVPGADVDVCGVCWGAIDDPSLCPNADARAASDADGSVPVTSLPNRARVKDLYTSLSPLVTYKAVVLALAVGALGVALLKLLQSKVLSSQQPVIEAS